MSIKICQYNPHAVTVGQKYRACYTKTLGWFITAADKIAMKALSSGEIGSGCQDSGGEVNINWPSLSVMLYVALLVLFKFSDIL